MRVRNREPVKVVVKSGFKIFDLYDLMDRAGTVTFRFTKKYINLPLTAAATGLVGNQVGGDALDWHKLIYTPLIITAVICLIGIALKTPNFLSAAKRNFARLQGQLDMVQLKRNRRLEHAKQLWSRHYCYKTRERYSAEEIELAEQDYRKARAQLVSELTHGISESSIDHLELENYDEVGRAKALAGLAEAMEFETPTSSGIERCETAFIRTLMYSLRSVETQKETQEKSGYVFREYKGWLRRTFFDPHDPPLAARMDTDIRLKNIRKQLKNDGVRHDPRVRQNWFIFPGLAQRFWHSNTTRKVSLLVGMALHRLSGKYNTHLTVQSVLWPGNWKHAAFQVTARDGKCLGDELHAAGKRTIRTVYGNTPEQARQMLDRATLHNDVQIKGLRVLADYAYCSGDGLDQEYLTDLRAMGCEGELLDYHTEFVRQSEASMNRFIDWLKKEHPRHFDDSRKLSALKDAYHRNAFGLRRKLNLDPTTLFNLRQTPMQSIKSWWGIGFRTTGQIIEHVTSDEGMRAFEEERDSLRIYDVIARLEQDTYQDLIEKLGEYDLD